MYILYLIYICTTTIIRYYPVALFFMVGTPWGICRGKPDGFDPKMFEEVISKLVKLHYYTVIMS